MLHLLRTEWLKIKSYPAFWLLIGLTTLSYPGVNYIFKNVYKKVTGAENKAAELAKMIMGNPFSFPEVWRTVSYFSSWFVFIPAVLVIMLITNEYSFKTHRQNIIDGWSRNNFMLSKFIDVVLVALIITILFTIVALVMGSTSGEPGGPDKWSLAYYIGLFALQTFAQLSIAFMIGLLVRRAFIALSIFMFYYLVAEPIGAGVLKVRANDIGRFLPLEISDRLLPVPAFIGKINKETYDSALAAIPMHVWLTFLLLGIIWSFCFWLYKRRDL